MDILTLELFDRSVSQVLSELHRALEEHAAMPLRVYLDGEETLLHNVQRLLDRQGRKSTATALGNHWQVDVAPGPAKVRPIVHMAPEAPLESAFRLPVPAEAAPPVRPTASSPRPVVLLHSAFSPGDRALGRRLLLGILRQISAPTPWLLLAHEALELLQDPQAMEVLTDLQTRGIPVKLSRESLTYWNLGSGSFEILEDETWQARVGTGDVVLLG